MTEILKIDTSSMERMAVLLPRESETIMQYARAAMDKSVHYLRTLAVSKSRQKELVGATGLFAKGWQADVRGSKFDLMGKVINVSGHAWYVNFGRAPGRMPPEEPIRMWVVRKGLLGSAKSLRRSGESGEKAVAQLTFLIRRAIARRGTIARFMGGGRGPAGARVFEETLRDGKGQVIAYFQQATEKARDLMSKHISNVGSMAKGAASKL